MNYTINLLEREQKKIDRAIKNNALMELDIIKANHELSKVNELKKAIKILKKHRSL